MLKTPLRARIDNNNWFSLLDADGHCIARCFRQDEITELTRIVNAHEAMKKALEAMLKAGTRISRGIAEKKAIAALKACGE